MKYGRKFFLALIIGTAGFISSCQKDDSGDDRDKYTGSWVCNETSQQQGTSTYTMTVSKDVTSADKIIAKNFYGLGSSTNTFIVVDGNNMTIQTQEVSGHTLSGTGTYSNNTLTINFSANDGQTVDQVTINAHR